MGIHNHAIGQLDIFWEYLTFKVAVGRITFDIPEREITLLIDNPPNAPPVTEGILTTVPGLFTNPPRPGSYTWVAQAKGAAPGSAMQTLPGNQTIVITPEMGRPR